MLNSNAPLAEIKYLLTNGQIVRNHQIGEAFYTTKSTVDKEFKGIPLYNHIIKQLAEPDTLSLRAKLQEDISSMSAIDKIFSRTRKREVSTEERQQTERKAHKIIVNLSEDERMIFDEVIDDYLESKGGIDYDIYGEEVLPRGTVLGLIQRKRMVASSVNGFRLFTESDCDVPTFCKRIEEGDFLQDAKVDKLLEIFKGIQAAGNNKVILFSIFKFTIRYLEIRLQKLGVKTFVIHGDVREREKVIHEFRNCSAFCILLSTEVGSEGLDYQFCNMMINYDLPWNPMKIEQRIGRIDRRGQRSEAVSIYNMITNGTVDADIYYRCLKRIGIFENSIGECEEILGDIAVQIDQIAVDASLTDEERKEKLEQMADNEIRKIQELTKLEEEEKEFFGFNISEYTTTQEIHNAENPWLSQKNLQIMIEQYLNHRLGQGTYIVGDGEVKQLRLSATARQELRDDFRKLPSGRNAVRQSWDIYLKGKVPLHKITFDSDAAEKNRNAFFITTMHPLVKQAAAYYKTTEKAYIRLQYANDDLQNGIYHFSVYAWTYVGINPHFKLVVVCDDDVIASELPDILQEAQSCAAAVNIKPYDWDILEKKQVKLWQEEKNTEITKAETVSIFKIESLTNNWRNRKRSLKQKTMDTSSESIRRMYNSELESAQDKYDAKVAEIKQKVAQTDIHTTLIANGILEVI